jgi:hypothetical protein
MAEHRPVVPPAQPVRQALTETDGKKAGKSKDTSKDGQQGESLAAPNY